jgi:hypothetical protein
MAHRIRHPGARHASTGSGSSPTSRKGERTPRIGESTVRPAEEAEDAAGARVSMRPLPEPLDSARRSIKRCSAERHVNPSSFLKKEWCGNRITVSLFS